jgi:hypothetical protein
VNTHSGTLPGGLRHPGTLPNAMRPGKERRERRGDLERCGVSRAALERHRAGAMRHSAGVNLMGATGFDVGREP